ncbi:hypothetical protein GF359_06470 [candidate division WOR-3 bacterium]|uniref:Dipeptidylpeptidase IV N-terminal domain-containing protein n=1 Tax=candidate division WOR-3 bacterium TaxID=2052148 RepID=A0A9D5QCM6_UNCW3|nr:hypothetical protein [candidate division WOR-3 bacterium]MBD3364843.1 hypothetical protein [candidate division WOR-3 bacterium]
MKKRLTFLGMSVIILGGILLSCTPTIEGDLRMLVENTFEAAYSPRWSMDGSKLYFIQIDIPESASNPREPDTPGEIWAIDVSTLEQTLICEDTFAALDIFREEDICLPTPYIGDDWIRTVEIETWTIVDSIEVEEIYGYPRFSMESSQVIYYVYRGKGWDSTYVYKADLEDDTTELILVAGQGISVTPGPGDTLFAVGDTVYNIKNGDRIPLDIDPASDAAVEWNPVNPSELVVCEERTDKEIFLFNLETGKRSRIKSIPDQAAWVHNPVFSPDGTMIAFEAAKGGDSFYDYSIWVLEFVSEK